MAQDRDTLVPDEPEAAPVAARPGPPQAKMAKRWDRSKTAGASSVVESARGKRSAVSSSGRLLSWPKMASSVRMMALSAKDAAKARGSRMTTDCVLTLELAIFESHHTATRVKR